jgi:hypothetical protein
MPSERICRYAPRVVVVSIWMITKPKSKEQEQREKKSEWRRKEEERSFTSTSLGKAQTVHFGGQQRISIHTVSLETVGFRDSSSFSRLGQAKSYTVMATCPSSSTNLWPMGQSRPKVYSNLIRINRLLYQASTTAVNILMRIMGGKDGRRTVYVLFGSSPFRRNRYIPPHDPSHGRLK